MKTEINNKVLIKLMFTLMWNSMYKLIRQKISLNANFYSCIVLYILIKTIMLILIFEEKISLVFGIL